MDYKPILVIILALFGIGTFMTLVITPFVGDAPDPDSSLIGFISFIEDGFTFDFPVLGEISFNPISWFWLGIDAVTDNVVSNLIALSYLPNWLSIPIVVLIIGSFLFVVLFIIKDLIPFT